MAEPKWKSARSSKRKISARNSPLNSKNRKPACAPRPRRNSRKFSYRCRFLHSRFVVFTERDFNRRKLDHKTDAEKGERSHEIPVCKQARQTRRHAAKPEGNGGNG